MFCQGLSVGKLGSCPISRISSFFPPPSIGRGVKLSVLSTVLVSTQDLESPYNPHINALSYQVSALVPLELSCLRIALVEEYPGSQVG